MGSVFIIQGPKKSTNDPLDITFIIISVIVSFIIGYCYNLIVANYFISKSKCQLLLKIICNVLGILKTRIPSDPFVLDLDQFIKSNKLSLILYYINNPQYPILSFEKDKIRYFTQEYDWKTFKWKYFVKNKGKNSIDVIEFEGINQNNQLIKDNIDFEKIEAKDNEIILLFILHDLLFGKGLSRKY